MAPAVLHLRSAWNPSVKQMVPGATAGHVPTLVPVGPLQPTRNLSNRFPLQPRAPRGSLSPHKQPRLHPSIHPRPHRSRSYKQQLSPRTCVFGLSWTNQFPTGGCGSRAAWPVLLVPTARKSTEQCSGQEMQLGQAGLTPLLPTEPTRPAHGLSTCLPRVFFFPSQLPAAWGGRGEWQLPASQAPPRYLQAQRLSASKRESK